jgi:hypothetical protein
MCRNNSHFTEKMIIALVTYTLNVYPQGVQINRMVDPLVECIMGGATSTSWPEGEILDAFNGYKQKEEKECYCAKDEWQPVDHPKGFIRIISV